MQDQWTLQFFLNVVEFGMDLAAAVEMPAFETRHFIDSFYPKGQEKGVVFVEEGIPMETLYKLQNMGHRLVLVPVNSSQVCAVRLNFETGTIECAASSKYEGQAYACGW